VAGIAPASVDFTIGLAGHDSGLWRGSVSDSTILEGHRHVPYGPTYEDAERPEALHVCRMLPNPRFSQCIKSHNQARRTVYEFG
jgi:hypothetical protein